MTMLSKENLPELYSIPGLRADRGRSPNPPMSDYVILSDIGGVSLPALLYFVLLCFVVLRMSRRPHRPKNSRFSGLGRRCTGQSQQLETRGRA